MTQHKKNLSYPKEHIRILLLEGIHSSAIKQFNQHGYTAIDSFENAWTEEELLENIENYHIIGIRSKTKITNKVIAKADKLLSVGCFCIGTNQVNLDAATEAGIAVFNSPYSNTRSVAELVVAEIILLMRRIPERDKAAHNGLWFKDAKDSYEVRGKTLGIVGYGHIGTQVSVLAENFGLKVFFYDIYPKLPMGNATPVKSLEELLRKSDIVTLHVPATPETKLMINRERISMMKKGAALLNLSRGSVVDIDALKEALENGSLIGAAVDVFPTEPESKGPGFDSSLRGLANVILTPHIGGSTVEAQHNIGLDVSQKLINLIDVGTTVGSESVPPLSLPVQHDTHRILHIHANMPGVLSEINHKLSDLGINIVGQYLKTNEKIGYVVLDISKNGNENVLTEMKNVKHTIKSRILY